MIDNDNDDNQGNDANNANNNATDDDEQRLLQARARQLARPPRDAHQPRASHQALVVVAGGVRVGFDLALCLGAMTAPPITVIPLGPSQLAGVALVRGRAVACFHLPGAAGLGAGAGRPGDPLQGRLGPGQPAATPRRLVLIGRKDVELGFVADDASEVVAYDNDDLHPLSQDGAYAGLPVRGVLADGLVLLDAVALLDDARFNFLSSPPSSSGASGAPTPAPGPVTS